MLEKVVTLQELVHAVIVSQVGRSHHYIARDWASSDVAGVGSAIIIHNLNDGDTRKSPYACFSSHSHAGRSHAGRS